MSLVNGHDNLKWDLWKYVVDTWTAFCCGDLRYRSVPWTHKTQWTFERRSAFNTDWLINQL